MAIGRNTPALANGYRFISRDRETGIKTCKDGASVINRNIDINSTHPRNSPGHPTKQPKQGSCFSWLFGR